MQPQMLVHIPIMSPQQTQLLTAEFFNLFFIFLLLAFIPVTYFIITTKVKLPHVAFWPQCEYETIVL